MDRREFVSLAAAAPGLPLLAGTATRGPGRTSAQAFTFYSPLAEEWHRGGSYFP